MYSSGILNEQIIKMSIYNWYPLRAVKRTYDDTEHVAEKGEPYTVSSAQSDATVTLTCNDPSLIGVPLEQLSPEQFKLSAWKYGVVQGRICTKWAKTIAITALQPCSTVIKAQRSRTGESATAALTYVNRDTNLYTKEWYQANGTSVVTSNTAYPLCDQGSKADTGSGTTKDDNRIAVGDKVVNASTPSGVSMGELTFNLYKSGKNSNDVYAPGGEPIATIEPGETSSANNEISLVNGALYFNPEKLDKRQVYTLVVEGKKGSWGFNSTRFDWGSGTKPYFIYNLYGDGYDNQIAFTPDSNVEYGTFEGGYYAILDPSNNDAKEFYVKSYYSALYQNSGFSSDTGALSFKVGNNTVSTFSRRIVNAKADDTTDSNKANGANRDESNYLHIYADPSKATHAGTEINITVTHPEFADRTKESKLYLFKKVDDQSFDVIERHSEDLTLKDTGDEEISSEDLANYEICELLGWCKKIKNGDKTEIKEVENKSYKIDNSAITLNYTASRKEQETTKKGSNKYLARINLHSTEGSMNVIARTLMSNNSSNSKQCDIVFRHKKTGAEFKVTVNTVPFEAKLYGVYDDNLGFAKKGEDIFVEQNSFFRGDKVVLSSNSNNFSADITKAAELKYTTGKNAETYTAEVSVMSFVDDNIPCETVRGTYANVVENVNKVLTSTKKDISYEAVTLKQSFDNALKHGEKQVTANDYLRYTSDGLKIEYSLTDNDVAKDFWNKKVFTSNDKDSKYYTQKMYTGIDNTLKICPERYCSIINRLWVYDAEWDIHKNGTSAGVGGSVWNVTNQVGENRYYSMARSKTASSSSTIPNNPSIPYLFPVSQKLIDAPNSNYGAVLTEVLKDVPGYSMTVYDYLNIGNVRGHSRTVYAGRQITSLDGAYDGKVNYGLPNTFAISPFGEGCQDYVQAVKNSSEQLKNNPNSILANGIVARSNREPDKSSIESPITLQNSTTDRILCAMSWDGEPWNAQYVANVDKPVTDNAIQAPETAIANFSDSCGGNGTDMLYFHIPLTEGDGVIVTYKKKDESRQIICKGVKEQCKKVDSETVLNETNVFTRNCGSTYVKAGANNKLNCSNISGDEAKDSKLVVAYFNGFFDLNKLKIEKIANGTGQGTTPTSEMDDYGDTCSTIRLNAKELGWLEDEVEYVDVDITVILSNFGYRQVTFPYRFLNNAKQ